MRYSYTYLDAIDDALYMRLTYLRQGGLEGFEGEEDKVNALLELIKNKQLVITIKEKGE